MGRHTPKQDELRRFAQAMEVRRLHPKLWHFSYWTCRNNRMAFDQFWKTLKARHGTGPIRILDIGCGFKPWLTAVRESPAAGPVLFHGTDFSAAWSDADAVALADRLPVAANSVDGVILSEVVEHCPFPRQVIGEALRILRPGGLILVTTPFVFPEHGIPYDFQRLTRYFYQDVFRDHDVLLLAPSNCQFTTPFASMNTAVDSSLLSRIPVLPDLFYLISNLATWVVERSLELLGPKFMRSWRDVFYTMPMGYAVIARKRSAH